MIHNCRTSSSGNLIFINKFTLREINFALRAMDLRKSPGPDGIHGFMIGHLGPHGIQKLLDIFNFSWKIGRLPRDWKRATIIPILKPGKNTSTSASYRPIGLTSFVCKLMERLVLARLNRIRDAQNKKPTNHTVAALLDLSRTFDRVWRQLLITKLHNYFSIRGRALPWISDFLWDRSIRVKYNNCLSDPFAIRQGVPQGSVLSPVLFSLYITGIEKVLAKHCEVGIFADDIITWSSGSNVGENELKLNRAMEEAHSFAEMHKFNASKSLTTFFSTLDQEITSNKHIEGQVIKSRKRLNVLKFITGRDWGVEASTLRTTFISLIRPVLEFGIPIYSCASDTNLNKLERVQLCAARIITGLRYSCQIDIVLFESNLPSLSKRRLYRLTSISPIGGDIGDQTSLDILNLLHDLSSGHSIHFQWIPSHVGIEGNERADFVARTAAVEGVSPRGNHTFSEISTISKLELNRQIKTPPSHAWYFAKCPGESFRLSSRPLQSTYSRFLSGHTRALRFSNGQKTFPEFHWCSSGEASPNHILLYLGFKKDEVLCDPLLFLDFADFRIHMGIV
ncbi:probable RNA-directed DNA polymerase from transposon BS [Trichonephila clavipes]|nr:probable RNA-directed DNA polymerase from transposon BS [Trichonephila clavipes]